MATKPLPPARIIRQLLDYDPETGILTWLPRGMEFFDTYRSWSLWNARYAGKPSGHGRTYLIVKLLGHSYVAHRLIWKFVTGEDPEEVDHINRDKHDNRWRNLRNVSRSLNMRNKGLTALNTSGHKHIHWSDRLERWVVQLIVPGKGQRQVAWEKTLPEAIDARDRLMIEHGYSLVTDAA